MVFQDDLLASPRLLVQVLQFFYVQSRRKLLPCDNPETTSTHLSNQFRTIVEMLPSANPKTTSFLVLSSLMVILCVPKHYLLLPTERVEVRGHLIRPFGNPSTTFLLHCTLLAPTGMRRRSNCQRRTICKALLD